MRRKDRHLVQLWDAQRWKPISGLAGYNPKHPAWLIAPNARFIASWIDDGIDILDPATLSKRTSIPAVEVTYTAWAVDPEARNLALANGRGAVFMADPGTGRSRRLVPGPSARVDWLRFSGDGAWLLAGSQDGSLWLWRREDGFTSGRRLHIGAPVSDAQVDLASGLLRAGDGDAVGVWQVSGVDEASRPALPRSPMFRHSREILRFGSDLHAASGLLATASIDGEVRLWRLPGSPMRTGTGAAQMTAQLAFDGMHYVAVDGHGAWVVRAEGDRPASPRFRHPQPIGFAALTADGRLLVTTSGRELRVFDWRQGRLRFPPLQLPNTPMKLALEGPRVYASYTVERGRPLTEAVAAYSLDDGRALAPPLEIAGGVEALLPTPDGQVLALLTGDGIGLFGAVDLRPLPVQREGDGGPRTIAGAASRIPRRIVRAVAEPDGIRIDGADGRNRDFAASVEPPAAVSVSDDGTTYAALLPGNRLVQLGDGRSTRTIDAPAGTQFARSAAFSRDGRMLAQALVDGVLLVDAHTGQWLAPPLRAPIPAPDVVAQVSFGPDGSRLLARTAFGRWLWWRLDADARSVDAIDREAHALAPIRGTSVPPSAQERRALRATDPGPTPQAQPAVAAGSCVDADPPLPARAPATPAQLLDLAPAPSTGTNPRRHSLAPTTLGLSNLCGLPMGVQRMDGVDFDLRAAVRPDPLLSDALYALRAAGREEGLAIAAGIRVPDRLGRITAFELLVTSPTFVQDPPPEAMPVQARLVVHYQDGGLARLPMRYGLDLTMWTQPPPASAHLAWRLTLPLAETGMTPSPTVDLYRVRLPNPYPDRRVRSLDIEAMPVTWNGVSVLAITVDAPPAKATGPGNHAESSQVMRPAATPVRAIPRAAAQAAH